MDEIDQANEKAEQFVADALKARTKKTFVRSGGVCASCNERIEVERLQVSPGTNLCHDCAEEKEAADRRALRVGG